MTISATYDAFKSYQKIRQALDDAVASANDPMNGFDAAPNLLKVLNDELNKNKLLKPVA